MFKRASLANSKKKTLVNIEHLRWVFTELQQRAGVHKAAALVGVSMPQFYNLKKGVHTKTRRDHMYNAFVHLAQLRKLQKCSPDEAEQIRVRQRVKKWRLSRGLPLTAPPKSATLH